MAIWLRIPKLPLELYHAQFLWRIGSALGNMLKVDRQTSIHSRGKFAHICVEMDLEKALPSHIVIRGHNLIIEYERLHQICFRCGRYGHKADTCHENLDQQVSSVKVGECSTPPPKVNQGGPVKVVDPPEMAPKPNGTVTTGGQDAGACDRADVEKAAAVDHSNMPVTKITESKNDIKLGPWNIAQRNYRPKNHQKQSNAVRDDSKGKAPKIGREDSKAVVKSEVKGHPVVILGKEPKSQGSRFSILNAVNEDNANQGDSASKGVDFALNSTPAQIKRTHRVRNQMGGENPKQAHPRK